MAIEDILAKAFKEWIHLASQVDILGYLKEGLKYLPKDIPAIYQNAVNIVQEFLQDIGLGGVDLNYFLPTILLVIAYRALGNSIYFVFCLGLFMAILKAMG